MPSHLTTAILASTALLALTAPAFALDGQDLLAKINAAYASGSGDLQADNVTVEGNDVVLNGARFVATQSADKAIDLGDLRFSDVEEGPGGSYDIGRVDFSNVALTEGNTSLAIKTFYLSGIHVPASQDGSDLNSLLYYREAHLGSLTVNNDGKQIASIESGDAKVDVSSDNKTLSFTVAVDGIAATLDAVKDAKWTDMVDSLGIRQLDGRMTMAGSWNAETGALDITDDTLDFDKVGRLQIKLGLSGYTMDLVHQIQQNAEMMRTAPEGEESKKAAAMAMLGLMQRLNFVGAEIRFDDHGITKRALDYTGKQQGADGEQMASTIKMMAPVLLMGYGLNDIADSVSAALNTYLDDPKSFTIRAAPPQPVPFPTITAAGMSAPQTLTKVLSVTVNANDGP
ncbi:hypothetical protein [Rhizobium halophytocola]|uniref:DUF945 family protein n=1 Tax=Rhizobium halophytocola TaxID=735519 RepID=A0ABS4DYD1_9HYPH|nr:hypothetical protein [Rhizobium halophytocola]MBP1850698.1 hypothetical protein [Rhizobium halophytocola]